MRVVAICVIVVALVVHALAEDVDADTLPRIRGLARRGDLTLGLQWTPYQNSKMSRWPMIFKSFDEDPGSAWWRGQRDDPLPLRVLDIGSNEGFFSMHVATLWPHARVLSVDGDDFWMGRHQAHIAELGLKNNYACKTKLSEEVLDKLMAQPGATFDLQFILSVVHWFPFKDTLNDFCHYVGGLMRRARVTIIELPKMKGDTGFMAGWYYSNGRTEDSVLRECAIMEEIDVTVVVIGTEVSTEVRDAQNRKVIRVDNHSFQGHKKGASCDDVIDALGCEDTTTSWQYCTDFNKAAKGWETVDVPAGEVAQSGFPWWITVGMSAIAVIGLLKVYWVWRAAASPAAQRRP